MHLYRKYILPNEPPKTFLITGGSSGIGRAAALLFAALGHHVAVTARRMDRLEDLKKEVEAKELPGRISVEVRQTDPAAYARSADSGRV
jgi:short-subunit dehydrogenase